MTRYIPKSYECPSCGDIHCKTVNSRWMPHHKHRRRRRECKSCGVRFSTIEIIIPTGHFKKSKEALVDVQITMKKLFEQFITLRDSMHDNT